jgi:hypothetical protein
MPVRTKSPTHESNGHVANGKPRDAAELDSRIANLEHLLDCVKPVPNEPKGADEGFVTRCIADVEPTEVRWLWERRIPLGKLTNLQGDPGTGKTHVACNIIAVGSRGGTFPDGARCETFETLFVTAEDGIADTIRPRLDAMKADVSRIHYLELVRDGGIETTLDLDKHLAKVDRWLREHPDVRLVVFDPLAAFLGKLDSHKNADVRGLLGRLARLAEQRNLAVLSIAHLTKAFLRAVHRSLGSIAFTAAARAVWQVSSDPHEPERRLLLPVKMNLAKVSGLAFRIGDDGLTWERGDVTTTADEAMGDGGDTPRSEAKDWIVDLLRNGPCPAKDVERRAKEDGICIRTLKYAKKELGVQSQRENDAWSWVLPKRVNPADTKPLTPLPSYPLGKRTKKASKKVRG